METLKDSKKIEGQLRTNLIASPIHANLSSYTSAYSNNLINIYNSGSSRLMSLSSKAAKLTQQRLAADPNYNLGRGIAVRLAWQYEKLDLQLGGRGSEKWMYPNKDEILTIGKVTGAEGHHPKNVANHPEEQSNPNNIKFFKNRSDHLHEGHGGDFHNETDGQMIDRQLMVTKTKNMSVLKNEMRGAGLSAIIGFSTVASMSFIIELSQAGISYEKVKDASLNAMRSGAVGAEFALGSYFIYRSAEAATNYILDNSAINLSGKVLKGVKGGIPGGVLILGTSTYNYIQMRNEGYSVQDSLTEAGKQAAIPTAILVACIYSPDPVSKVIGLASSAVYMLYFLIDGLLEQGFSEDLKKFQLELFFEKAEKRINTST